MRRTFGQRRRRRPNPLWRRRGDRSPRPGMVTTRDDTVGARPVRRGIAVDFALSPAAQDYAKRLEDFMDSQIFPAEKIYESQRSELMAAGKPHTVPPVIEDLKAEAKSRGLWNLFLPDVSGLSNVDYAHLAEIMGRSGH